MLIGAPPLDCDTCVMMLAGPPADAMTYVKDSSGLEPSLYGGGGSPSSRSLLLEPSFVSRGRAALVSATAFAAAEEDDSVKGGAGAKAGGESDCDGESWRDSSRAGKKREEKDGGYGESPAVVVAAGWAGVELETEAVEMEVADEHCECELSSLERGCCKGVTTDKPWVL